MQMVRSATLSDVESEDLEIARRMKLWTKVPGARQPLPDPEEVIKAAARTVKRSKKIRRRWAKRREPRNPERLEALQEQRELVAAVSKEMRRLRGAAQWKPRYDTPELRQASRALINERKRLHDLLKCGTLPSDV